MQIFAIIQPIKTARGYMRVTQKEPQKIKKYPDLDFLTSARTPQDPDSL